MKPVKFLQIFALLLTLSSCDSCKEDFTELPPETQTGANTFGCLIDGKLFIGGYFAPWMHAPLSASYSTISDKLFIGVYGKINDQSAGSIAIEVDTPRENSTQKLSRANYGPDLNFDTQIPCIIFEIINDGICTITKLDTLNKIVSGRFQFVGYCNNGDSTYTKQITEGRFDLKFDIYHN